MKAPDKIYALLDERIGYLSHTFTNAPCSYESCKDIEYIRKDALLEWLESVLKCKPQDAGLFTEAAAIMLQQIIDKINSL